MGSNYFILDKKSKEYCWLGKSLNKAHLVRFVREHPSDRGFALKPYDGLLFGACQGRSELYELWLGITDPYILYGGREDDSYIEVDYSMET